MRRQVFSKPVKVDFYTKAGDKIGFKAHRTFERKGRNMKTRKKATKAVTVKITVTVCVGNELPVVITTRLPKDDALALRSLCIVGKWALETT